MIAETDIFDPRGSLPDVSQSIVIGGQQSASALAGVASGQDYAKAIYAAAYRPVQIVQRKEDDLDESPVQKVNRAALERKNLAREIRNRVTGRGRPDSYTTGVNYDEPPLPGTETSVANGSDPGNLLGVPPPTDDEPGIFPTHPPLLPPPLTREEPWKPEDIFRGIF